MIRLLALSMVLMVGMTAFAAQDEDTPEAAKTRKLLETKITVSWKDVPLKEVLEEIKEDHVKGIKFLVDTKGGVSQNQKMTFSGKEVTLAEAFDKMFTKNGLGYVVISKKGNAYNGLVQIKQGKERGYPASKN